MRFVQMITYLVFSLWAKLVNWLDWTWLKCHMCDRKVVSTRRYLLVHPNTISNLIYSIPLWHWPCDGAVFSCNGHESWPEWIIAHLYGLLPFYSISNFNFIENIQYSELSHFHINLLAQNCPMPADVRVANYMLVYHKFVPWVLVEIVFWWTDAKWCGQNT